MSLETKIRESAARRAASAPELTTGWNEVRAAIGRDAARRPARIAMRAGAAAAAVLALIVIVPKLSPTSDRRIDAAYRPPAFAGKLPAGAVEIAGGTLDGVEYRLRIRSSRIINLSGPDIIDHKCVDLRIEYPGKGDPFWTTGNIVMGGPKDCAVLTGVSAIGALANTPFAHRQEMPYHGLGVVAAKIVRLEFVLKDGKRIEIPTHPVAGYPLRAWVYDFATGTQITEMIGTVDDGRTVRLNVKCAETGWPGCTNGVDGTGYGKR